MMLESSFIPYFDFDNFSPFIQIYPEQYEEYVNNFDSNSCKYPDISEYIKSLDNNVSKILKNSNIGHLIQVHHPQIIKFLCQNIDNLILLSFDQTKEHEYQSKLSFSILLSGEPLIHYALSNINNSTLKKMSNIALQRKDDYYAMHKLIQIIQFTIQFNYYLGQGFPLSLAFICIFIPYISEESIYTFFEIICSNYDCFAPVQVWLLEQANFPIIVIDELLKVKNEGLKINENENNLINDEVRRKLERETQKASNILKLISLCLQSKILNKEFYNYKLIEILNDDWSCLEVPDALLNELWNTISKIYTKETAPLMQGLFQKAIEIMTESYVTIKPFRISVIKLISKMIIIDETLRPYVISFHIEETVLRLIIQFPGHTFLQKALLSLCCSALEISQMKFFFSKALISPLINKSMEDLEGKFIIEFTCQLIQKALDIGQSDKKLLNYIKGMNGFNDFYNIIMKKRNKLIKNGYGGRISIFKSKSVIYLS